ncbi:CRISPR-associated endonuclease Cas1 [Metallibacterium scheffleri]|uniref:CRISPR-associated endonuclease Cas1 n=1 Tax=Metallibacterium scheffleri TaxID=993689 RepID=UPI0023F499E6|nr:CRISPR-associated endonuclease Cas1 [Metallibacterium scheffleri]
MGILFVDHHDTTLAIEQGNLVLRVPDAPGPRHLPLALIERVVLRARTQLDSQTLATLADAGIGVIAHGGRGGQRVAQILGAAGNDARRRIAQVRKLDDAAHVLHWSQTLIRAKLRAQRRFIASLMQQRPDQRKPLFDAFETLGATLQRLPRVRTVESVRGLEGAAAAAYFAGFASVLPPELGFTQRNRRPPRDPVNACLSLGYTLLHSLLVETIYAHGLDPMIGYLHVPEHGRASLAADLMEPWRPWIDRRVHALFRSRRLSAEHFGRDGGDACIMGKAGRQHFYTDWAQAAPPLRRALRRPMHEVLRAISPDLSL